MSDVGARPTIRDLLKVREYRALLASLALSAGGDRIALVALTLLVYDRSGSPLLAAIAYAAGTIPYLSGFVLGGLADRWDRRRVMITCDMIRMVLTAAMTIPHMPMAGLIILMWVTGAAQPPFDAARSAITRDILEGQLYTLSIAVTQTTFRVILILGAAIGGLFVAIAGARAAIGADAATFAASAALIFLFIRRRNPAPASTAVPPGAGESRTPPGRTSGGTASGFRLVFSDPALRTITLLGWLAMFYEVPEGIAAPYAKSVAGNAADAGFLIASSQALIIMIAPLYARLPAKRRERWMGPMAIASSGLLMLTAFRPSLAATMVILAVAGAFGAYQITANTAFAERVDPQRRGQAFSIAATGLVAGQGAGFAVAGLAARYWEPTSVTAIAGALGAVGAIILTITWHRQRARGRHRKAAEPEPTHLPSRAVPVTL